MKNRIILALTLSASFLTSSLQASTSSPILTDVHQHSASCFGELPKGLLGKSASKQSMQVGGTDIVRLIQTDEPYGFALPSSRQSVSNAFFFANPDDYDYLFVFTDFDIVKPANVLAYYNPVRANEAGINIPTVNFGAAYGSASRLQGIVDFGGMSQYSFSTTDSGLQGLMKAAVHEVMHRYGPNLRYQLPGGDIKTDLINSTNPFHWSYATDTDASFMYGARWVAQPNGSFLATQIVERLSPLDLYTAGWLPANEIPDTKLLQISPAPTTNLPAVGTNVQTTTSTVTGAQILAAEGPRVPSFPNTQRNYRAAMILLNRPGAFPTDDKYKKLELFSRAFEDYFSSATGGRASISFRLEGALQNNREPFPLSYYNGASGVASIAGMADFLENKVFAGSVADRDATKVRDTLATFMALSEAKPSSTKLVNLLNWLKQSSFTSADAASAVLLADSTKTTAITKLLLAKRGNQFAASEEFSGTKFDSLIAASALERISGQSANLDALRNELGTSALGYTESGQARLVPTIMAAIELFKDLSRDNQRAPLTTFVRSQYNAGGLFEGAEANLYASMLTLQNAEALGFDTTEADQIEAFLKTKQNGSHFANSAFLTANGLLAYSRNQRPDLKLDSAPVADSAFVGERVSVRFVVKNNGKSASLAAKAKLQIRQTDGSWADVPGLVDIPPLATSQTTQLALPIESAGLASPLQLAVVLDSNNVLFESYERNNRTEISVVLETKPAGAEIAVGLASIAPNPVSRLPTALNVSAEIRNFGLSPANGFKVGLYAIKGSALELVSEQTKTLAPGATETLNFSFSQVNAIDKRYAVIADHANLIPEAIESNNRVELDVSFVPVTDLELTAANLVFVPDPPQMGANATLKIRVQNTGTLDLGDVLVNRIQTAPSLPHGSSSSQSIAIKAGETKEVLIEWIPTVIETVQFDVKVDPNNRIAEVDESNNNQIRSVTIAAQSARQLTEWDDKFDETVYGLPNYINGLGGNDVIRTLDGQDRIFGGAGDDYLACSSPNCEANGGEGDDKIGANGDLTGGKGDDKFVPDGNYTIHYALGDGKDIVSTDSYLLTKLLKLLQSKATTGRKINLLAPLAPSTVQRIRRNNDLILQMPDGGEIRYDRFFAETFYEADAAVLFDGNVTWTFESLRKTLLPTFSADINYGYIVGNEQSSDDVFGTELSDSYSALGGADKLFGNDGADDLNGGAGNDALSGGGGNDVLRGGSGNDNFRDAFDTNQCFGEGGHDDIMCSGTSSGGTGNDLIKGDYAEDTLNGDDGRDVIEGFDGNDTLTGGLGHDRLSGGDGQDRYIYAAGDGTDRITDEGSNTLVLSVDPSAVSLSRVEGELFIQVGTNLNDQIRARGIDQIEFSNGVVWTTQIAQAPDQTGTVSQLIDTAGDDVLIVDHTGDTITGPGGGNDRIETSVDFVVPYTHEIEKTMATGTKPIRLEASCSKVLVGNDAANEFVGGVCNSIAYGGKGDDLYGNYTKPIELPNEGNDEALGLAREYLSHDPLKVGLRFADLTASSNIEKFNGPGTGSDSAETFDAQPGYDIPGSLRILNGGLSADTYLGGSVRSVFVVESAGDQIIDDGDNEETIMSAVDYTLPEPFERLTLLGNSPITATGSAGSDHLNGELNSAANVLSGGAGDDTYTLGIGDSIIEDANGGSDTMAVSGDWVLDPALSVENIRADGSGFGFHFIGDSRDNKLDWALRVDAKGGDDFIRQATRSYAGEGDDRVENASAYNPDSFAEGGLGNDAVSNVWFVDFKRGDGKDVLSNVRWLRLKDYAANELVATRIERDLVLSNAASGDQLTLKKFFEPNTFFSERLTLEFTDGLRTIADYAQLLPVANIQMKSRRSARSNAPVMRAVVNAGNYGEVLEKVEFSVSSSPTSVDTEAPFEIVVPHAFADEVYVDAIATYAGGRTARSTAKLDFFPTAVPYVEIQSPFQNERLKQGQVIQLQAYAEALNSGSITKVEFLANGTVVGQDTSQPYEIDWTVGTAGSFNITARATDSTGLVATSTAIPVTTFSAPYVAPTVRITAPIHLQSIPAGSATVVTAVAIPSNGRTISKVEFYPDSNNVGPFGTDTTAPYSANFTPDSENYIPDAEGKITIRVVAYQSDGNGAYSLPTTLFVGAVGPSVALTAPSAGSNLTVNQASPLTASASVPSGRTVSKVEFFNGATLLGTDTTSPYSFAWTPTAIGSVSLTAKVTDSTGAVATSTAVAAEVIASTAPTVSITAPAASAQLTVNTVTNITANASATSGRTISKVEFFNGTTLLGTDTTSPYSFAWTPTATGAVSLTAKATDSASATTTSAAVSVNVIAAVAAPTVSITAPAASTQLTVNTATNITANAAAGSGRTISKVEFFNGATLLGTDTTSPYSFAWTPTVTGAVSLTAKATDSTNVATTSAAVSVTVIAAVAAPTVSITAPAASAQLTVNTATNIAASATAGSGRTISKVEFFNGATLLGTDTTSPYSFAWTPTATGAVSLTAKATDSANVATTSAAVSVTVVAAVAAPTVSITSPAANAQLTVNTATNITANAAAGSGRTISKVEFFNGAALLGTDTTSPYSFAWTPTVTGAVSLTAKATDSANVATTSAAVSVSVIAPVPPPTVSITAPGANAQLGVNLATTITATAAAGSGRTIIGVEFFSGTTLLGADLSSPYSFSWTPTATGAVSLTAKVTDSANVLTTSAAVNVTVISTTPTVALTAPAANAQLPVNRAVNLTATAGVFAGRTVTKVEFFRGTTLIGSDTTSPYSLSWTPTATGAVSLTAKVTDSSNATATSAATSVTIVAQDGTPSAFSFTNVNAAPNTATTSNSITIAGYNIPIALTVSNGSYSINGGAFVTTAGTLNPGDTIRLRITSAGTSGTARTVTLTAGGVNGTFRVTTN
jgi:Ca2+-binding RTX toxin-like protein